MNIRERAEFLLALVSAEQMMIPAPLARKLAECQDWLESLADQKNLASLVELRAADPKNLESLKELRADPREKIDHDQGGE